MKPSYFLQQRDFQKASRDGLGNRFWIDTRLLSVKVKCPDPGVASHDQKPDIGDSPRHQIPSPCPHSPRHGIYIDRCITRCELDCVTIEMRHINSFTHEPFGSWRKLPESWASDRANVWELHVSTPASYPDVSLLMKMCAQRKAGRRQLYPSHGPLRFITCHSFRARLCHAKNEAPEEEAVSTPYEFLILSNSSVKL